MFHAPLLSARAAAPIVGVILVAPTSYKATIGASEAAEAIGARLRAALPEEPVVEMPLSDGGPGLLDALAAAGAAGGLTPARVSGPLGRRTVARVLRLGRRAVVESADACGLHLLSPGARDPLRATTRGVGELLLAASALSDIDAIACGLGGSASVDGGAGVGRALGFGLLDARGEELPDGGGALERLARIEPPHHAPGLPPIVGLADVRTRLTGLEGAARVFAPQKGADAAAVLRLERGLERLRDVVLRDLGVELDRLDGGGAAGGLGGGLVAFAGATLRPGSEWVMEAVGFDSALARARLVITGEGSYDAQSALGKITGAVVGRARARGVPLVLACGAIRTPLPEGVLGVDGGGEILSPERLGDIAAAAASRLLVA